MRKFRKYTATALVAMMVAGMTMSGYQPADVSASQESEYIIVTKDKKSMKTVESKYNTMIDTQEQNTDFLKDENVLVSKMTAKEADIVNKDQKVVSVEKNTMVNASETESTTAAKEDQGTDSQWNLKSIHVDKAKDTATDEKVKVALLDSGIDYQEGLNVKERVNLIEDDNEFSPMFEDSSNHGTSIASLIVSNNGKVKGINKNVELYSARILDENKQAPISRVVEGIYWAIDKKVNIISISFGTNQYSEALKQAIDEANAKGILVIAAAGNQGENGTDKDDSGVPGMTENPDFHGLYERRHSGNEEVNYLASYRFMIKIGNEYGKGKTYTSVSKADIPGLTDTSYSRIRSMMANLQKKSFFKNYSNANKKAFVFGVAMHTSTDTFAHSTYRYYNGTWYSITHVINEKKGQYKKNEADNSKFVPERFDMAYRAERNTLYRYQGKRSDVAVCHDFHAANDPDKYYPSNPAFKVKRISKYGTQVHLSDANVIAHFATINYN